MRIFFWVLTAVTALAATSANAKSRFELSEDSEKGITIAPGLKLEPTIEADIAYTDNLYRTRDNRKSTAIFLLKPSVDFIALRGTNQYAFSLATEVGWVPNSTQDSYIDDLAQAEASLELTSRHHLDVNAEFRHGHDPFGTARTAATAASKSEIDLWSQVAGLLTYTYGVSESPINLRAKLGASDKEYENNRQQTSPLNYNLNQLGVGGTYRYSPKTSFTADYDYYNIQFHTPTPTVSSRSGDAGSFLVGVKWQGSAKTLGTVQIGQYSRNFNAADRNDVSGLNWSASVAWRPKTYSVLTLRTAHVVNEAYFENEDFNSTQQFEADYTHDWSVRLHTNAGFGYIVSRYENSIAESRKERFYHYHGLLRYDLDRIWSVKAGFDIFNNNSSEPTFKYNLDNVLVGISASL